MTITHQVPGTFSAIFGLSFSTVTATATAAYRPRDVAIVLDYSGSMNNESDIWNCESYLGSMENTPNNTDPVFPQFGPYNPTFSPNATLQCTSSDSRVGMCNMTQSVLGIPAMADDFYQNNFGAGARSRLHARLDRMQWPPYRATTISLANGTCVLTWSNAVNPSSVVLSRLFQFQGLYPGAGLLGKDVLHLAAAADSDWRKLYFELTSGSPLNDNTKLWNSSGAWQNPAGNYIINYKAILNWIKNIGPNPFPSQLRAGNILYYSSIPSDVPAAAYDPTQPNSNINGADGGTTDQRFWKEYIDYVIGVWQDPNGNIQNPGTPDVQHRPGLHGGQRKSHPDHRPRLQVQVGLRGLHRSERQPETAPAPPLVRPHDDDPVHVGHRPVSRHHPRHLHGLSPSWASRGAAGHPEQSPQRSGLVVHVQPAAVQGEPTAVGQFPYARTISAAIIRA